MVPGMNKMIQEPQTRKPTDVRKREIIDAALGILAHNGARSFTAKNIAAEVGITSGAIFRHFESMEAIVVDVVAQIEATTSQDFPLGIEDPLERLKIFFLNRTRTILTHPNISRLLLSDHLDQVGGGVAAKTLTNIKSRTRKFIDSCIVETAQALPSGPDTGARVDTDVARIIVIGAILSMSHSNTRVVSETKSPQLAASVWRVIEQMLRIPRPPSK